MKIDVTSEIGELEGVIIHTPGNEVENMTPLNAERALYSDILNLSVALREYNQFKSVLKSLTTVFEMKDLMKDVLDNAEAKDFLISTICKNESEHEIKDYLYSLDKKDLVSQLIEGVPLRKDNLTKFLSEERYSLQPLHNFFFTRDASVTIKDSVLIAKLSNKVREREAIIMETIFNYHPKLKTNTLNPSNMIEPNPKVRIEGGDILVAREDVLLIGIGSRTSTHGIDFIIDQMKKNKEKKHIIVQELPESPESFIHLDMVFTFLDVDKCMTYDPAVFNQHEFQTVHITIDNGEVVSIVEEKNIVNALNKLGFQIEPISVGGNTDEWIQEREQWHSGANFFALAPGKVLGYERNSYTINELNKHGFEVIKATDVQKNKIELKKEGKYVFTINGSELARGGGGCRCMTMPFCRKPVKW
jgi:arginine deiminase